MSFQIARKCIQKNVCSQKLGAYKTDSAHTLHAKSYMGFLWVVPNPGLPGLKIHDKKKQQLQKLNKGNDSWGYSFVIFYV